MQRPRRVLLLIAFTVGACAGGATLRADADEQDTCDAVRQLGSIVDDILSGSVRAGDQDALELLAARAELVHRTATLTTNPTLRREARRADTAGDALLTPEDERSFDESPDGLVHAMQALLEECEALGVPAE